MPTAESHRRKRTQRELLWDHTRRFAFRDVLIKMNELDAERRTDGFPYGEAVKWGALREWLEGKAV